MNKLKIKLKKLIKELRGSDYPSPAFSAYDEGKRKAADMLKELIDKS